MRWERILLGLGAEWQVEAATAAMGFIRETPHCDDDDYSKFPNKFIITVPK